MVDLIEIYESDDDIPANGQTGTSRAEPSTSRSDEQKPNVGNVRSNIETQPNSKLLLEGRRKKISQLMDLYMKYHERLVSVEYMMSEEQLQRWKSHLAASYGPSEALYGQAHRPSKAPVKPKGQQSEPTGFDSQESVPSSAGWQRPPWFIDAQGESVNQHEQNHPTIGRRRVARRRRKTTTKRKTKAPKTRAITNSSSVSRKPQSTTSTRRKPSSSKAPVDKKPKPTKLQAMLAKVKKER